MVTTFNCKIYKEYTFQHINKSKPVRDSEMKFLAQYKYFLLGTANSTRKVLHN